MTLGKRLPSEDARGTKLGQGNVRSSRSRSDGGPGQTKPLPFPDTGEQLSESGQAKELKNFAKLKPNAMPIRESSYPQRVLKGRRVGKF